MAAQEQVRDGVSITEAARVLGISRPTLSKLLSDADFPRLKAGGKTLVSLAEVREFYEAHKAGASAASPRLQAPAGTAVSLPREPLGAPPTPRSSEELSFWGFLRRMVSPWG